MLLCLIRLSFPCIDVYGIQALPKVFENCSHNLVSTAKYYIAGCKIKLLDVVLQTSYSI